MFIKSELITNDTTENKTSADKDLSYLRNEKANLSIKLQESSTQNLRAEKIKKNLSVWGKDTRLPTNTLAKDFLEVKGIL